MSDRATLLALAERAEGGETGPKFTAEIIAAIVGAPKAEQSPTNGKWCLYSDSGRLFEIWRTHPGLDRVYRADIDLTTSIDAQEAALPGRISLVERDCEWRHVWCEGQSSASSGPSEPLARLAARLRAMAAAQEAPDGQ